MARPVNIADLAEELVRKTLEQPVKTAAANPSRMHPLAAELKKVAEELRKAPDAGDISLELIEKIAAMQPGTGAQSPSAGAMEGANLKTPKMPTLQTTGLGVTGGAGGVPPTLKLASELRKLAEDFRRREVIRSAHLLNGARALHYLREGLSA